MADYGLKVWTPAGYVAFDSRYMPSYVKVVASATATISGSSSTITIPAGFDYVYVNGPTGSGGNPYTVTNITYDSSVSGYTSFTINNQTGGSAVFGYTCIRL